MKKSILILFTVLTTISLSALGFMNWKHTSVEKEIPEVQKCKAIDIFQVNYINKILDKSYVDLVYKIDTRFTHTITMENLLKAQTIIDILPKNATESIVEYYSTRISILENDVESKISVEGDSEILNDEQIKLLHNSDNLTNFYVRADYKEKLSSSNQTVDNYLTYFTSIVPEKHAEYVDGDHVLIDYLKKSSFEKTRIITQDKLQPGKVNFVVTKEGLVSDVTLISTSGYPDIDDLLVDLIKNMPGKWNPAQNALGEKINQELVFFFGLEGC